MKCSLKLFVVSVLLTAGGFAQSISFVQGGKTGYRESSQVACPVETNTLNHLLLAAIYSTSNSVTLSVADALGNTWTPLPRDTSANGQIQVYYAIAKATSSNTIIATQSSGTAIMGLFCSEWSGNATSNVLDVQTATNASSPTSSMSSGNLTTTGSSDLLYCVFADKKEGAMTIGTGFTQDEIDTGFGALSEYKRDLTAGTYSCNATDTAASSYWLAYAAAFKAGGGNTPVASVNSTGLATGLAAGTSTITATANAISGSATLTVTTISFVQVTAATPQEPESTVTVTYPLAQTAGDLNIVVVGWNDTTSTVQSVKDSAGNSYSLAIGPTSGTAERQSIYYAKNILGGSNEVTVVFSQAAAFADIRILEYSGLDLSSPLDATFGASGNSANASAGPAATAAANELIFGANTVWTGNKTPGVGFTSRIITTPDSNIAEDRFVGTAGSYGASAALTSSGPWVMQMATFKAGTGANSLAPTITSVFPSSGTTDGGTVVTITGTNFAAGANVTFGKVSATDVAVASSTMMTAVTPPGKAGAVTVVVTKANSASASLADGFTYASNDILASGPLKVSSTNPRYFADGTGKAVYLTGAHTWQNNVDGWGIPNATPGAVLLSPSCPAPPAFDWAGYLDFVQAHQYNWIRLWTWELPTSNADAVPPAVNIATLSRASDVVTVTTAVTNPFVPGDVIAVANSNALSNTSFIGTFVISTVPVPGSQFTYQQVAPNASATGGTAAIVEPECHLPAPYERTGFGDATDGLPKFDLSQFDQSFFARLRQRVIDAGQLGIYVSVMLFDGHGLQYERLANDGYWFTGANNINGVDDGYLSGSPGYASQSLSIPAITTLQDAYVRNVIDSVNDLDNVMYEIANEAGGSYSTPWESHMIDLVHQYEAGLPKQHPVGFTCQFGSSPPESTYFNSNADWVAPCPGWGYGWGDTGAPGVTEISTGNKVVIDDTDHSWYWKEIVSATSSDPNAMRKWAWENFARGANTAFMDPYLVVYPGRNAPSGSTLDPYWNVIRTALTQTAAYAKRIDLGQAIPQNGTAMCSTSYCLTSEKQYLIYSPTGGTITVELAADTYYFEWFNPGTNAVAQTGTIAIPSSGAYVFTPPFSGKDAVLLLLGN